MCDKKRKCFTCSGVLDVCLFKEDGLICMVCTNLRGLNLERGKKLLSPIAAYHDKRLKRNYGISLSIYWKLYKEQEGKCLICEKHFPRDEKSRNLPLVVDHCHDTGEIRGLLCNPCNVGIGFLKNNPKSCFNARDYLRFNLK